MTQIEQFESETLYCLELDDFASPSFCTFGKSYFGTLPLMASLIESLEADERYSKNHSQLIQAFKEYCNGNTEVTHNVAYSDVPLLEPVSVYAQATSTVGFNKHEHLNIWDCVYYMRWKKAENNHIWFRHKNSYARCIKTQFHKLQFAVVDIEENYEPIDCYMGFPMQIVFEKDTVGNRLYVTEKIFDNEEELLQDIEKFRKIPDTIYTEIFNDIFGDG